jgi:outer membrane protein TolC
MQVTRIVGVLALASAFVLRAQTTPAPAPVDNPAAPATDNAPAAPPAPAPALVESLSTNRPASVQRVEYATRSISLQEAVESALQHNFDIQVERYNPEIARYNLGLAYGGYDPVAALAGQHSYSQSPGGIDAQGRVYAGNESETDSFRAGVSGLLPWTGLNYNLAGNASDSVVTSPGVQLVNPATVTPILATNINNPSEVFILGYETNYTQLSTRVIREDSLAQAGAMTLSQPLLKNFWIDPTRANIQVAKNRIKYTESALRYLMMTTIYNVEQAYFNLIRARENVKTSETALQLADRLLWENRKKVEVGQLAPLDEKQAESEAASRRADLLTTQRLLDSQENTFKGLITDDYRKWHNLRVIPAENLVAVPQVIDLQRSWDIALQGRPDLVQARLDVQRADISIRLYKNQLLPSLDVIGQYGYAGRGQEFSGAFGQLKTTDNPFWYYGAQVSYPIGSRTARNNYKISKAQKEQNQLVLKQKEQSVMIEVDDAVKLVQTSLDRVDATRQSRLFAEAALDAEQKKLENGKSTSFFVLQFQRDLTTARYQEIGALADYNIALAQLAFQEGASLERHKLNVEVK